jgi:hypothetical protein
MRAGRFVPGLRGPRQLPRAEVAVAEVGRLAAEVPGLARASGVLSEPTDAPTAFVTMDLAQIPMVIATEIEPMPFALLFIGILLIVVSVRNTQQAFLALLEGDFSGTGNFFYWIVALIVIGIIGYIPKAKPVSDALLVLILLALVLTAGKEGVFSQVTAALGTTKTPSAGSSSTAAASTLGSIISSAIG